MLIRLVVVVLSLIGFLALGAGLFAVAASKNAIQETPSLLVFLIGVAGLGFAATITAILRVLYQVERAAAETALARKDRMGGV